jgi:hypothetical protein
MQSAQQSQDVDPAEIGIAPKYREAMFGYKRIAKEIIDSIEDKLEELTTRQSSERQSSQSQMVRSRTPLSRWLLGVVIGVLLAAAIIGSMLVWEWPRSETVRSMIARSTPQPVLDLLSDKQDNTTDQTASADASAQAPSQDRTGSDGDQTNGVATPTDQSQLVQKMARDIATLQEGIDQLRAGQDQLLRMMMRPAGLNAQARTAVPRAIGIQQTTGLGTAPLPPRRPVAQTLPR